jgi:hypothetical protein
MVEWSDWRSLGGNVFRGHEVGQNTNSALEVFTIGGDNVLYHKYQIISLDDRVITNRPVTGGR